MSAYLHRFLIYYTTYTDICILKASNVLCITSSLFEISHGYNNQYREHISPGTHFNRIRCRTHIGNMHTCTHVREYGLCVGFMNLLLTTQTKDSLQLVWSMILNYDDWANPVRRVESRWTPD